MKPYYQDDSVTIYHGDALTVMNELEAPVVACITDPPYASGARQEAQRNASGAMLRGQRWASKPLENDQMTTTGFVWLMREVCYALRPMLVDGGALLSFIDWRQWPTLVGAVESTNLRVNGMVVWDKMSYGLGNGFRAQHELILFASRGTPHVVDRGIGNVLACRREANDDHPSPKPIGLMHSLLSVVSAPGDLLLDPFMGAGATLIAARDSERRCIGIEIEERYCELAAQRCAQEVLSIGETTA